MQHRTLLVLLAIILGIIRLFSAETPADERRELALVVRDVSDHQPISDVICQLFSKEGKVIAFSTTSSDGRVVLPYRENDPMFVVLRVMGYATKKVEVASFPLGAAEHTILLSRKEHKLREVTVKAPPISLRNDTLVYNIGSFKDKQDRYIGDVLKKLPGVEVSTSGAISYQGKPISKLYIEGQDLLGSRYNQATKNLPADAVSQVHLMENHQDVKVLRGKVLDDRAALNIKLKEGYRSKLFGYIDVGIGGTPIIWNNKLFMALVGRGYQMMTTAKMNNSGEDISGDTKEQISVAELGMSDVDPMPFVNISGVSTPPLSKQRYLRNKAYSVGVNNLFKTSEDSNLKLNLVGYMDKITKSSTNFSRFGGSQSIEITELNEARNRMQAYSPSLTYELNASRLFLKDELRADFSKRVQERTISTHQQNNLQEIELRPWSVQNRLNSTFAVGKEFITLNSLVKYFKTSERMRGEWGDVDAGGTSTFSTDYQHSRLSALNKMSFSLYSSRAIMLSTSLLGDYFKDIYHDLSSNATKGYTQESKLGLSPSLRIITTQAGVWHFNFPLSWNDQRIGFPQSESVDRYVAFSPSFTYRIEPNDRWRFNLNGSYIKDNDWASPFYAPLPLRRDYRTELNSLSKLYRRTKVNGGASVHYRNLLDMVFGSVIVAYSHSERGYYHDYDYQEDMTVVTIKDGKNNQDMWVVSSSMDKSFVDQGWALKLGVNYIQNNQLRSQSAELFRNRTHMITTTLSAEYKKLDWLKAVYNITVFTSKHENKFRKGHPLTAIDNDVNLYFFFTPKFSANMSYQNSINQLDQDRFKSSHFVDMGLHYKFNARLELRATLQNLLNHHRYFTSSIDGLNYFSNVMPLRGRKAMLSCVAHF